MSRLFLSQKKWPLAATLAFAIGTLVALSTAAVLLIQASNAWRVTRDLVAQNATTIVDSVIDQISVYLAPALTLVNALDANRINGEIDIDDQDSITLAIRNTPLAAPQISSVVFIDKHFRMHQAIHAGNPVAVETIDVSRDTFIRERIKQSQDLSFASWQGFIYVDVIKSAVITAAKSIINNGEFQGVFATGIQLRTLSSYLRDISERNHAEAFILFGDTHVIGHRSLAHGSDELSNAEPLLSLDKVKDPVLVNMWDTNRQEFESHENANAHRIEINGKGYVFVYKTITTYGKPWTVGAYFPDEDILASFDRLATAATVGIGFILLALLFGYWLAKTLARPVILLTSAAENVANNGPTETPKLLGSRIKELNVAANSFNHMVDGLRDREKTRSAFNRFVPSSVVSEIISEGEMLAPQSRITTTLFTDIVGFSTMAEDQSPAGLIQKLNDYFDVITPPVEKRGGVIYQFQGDAVLATFNLPVKDEHHAANAVRAAIEIQTLLQTKRFGEEQVQLKTRIGINTGEAVCGLVGGGGRLGFTVHGDDVNLASRVEGLNKQYSTNILITASTAELAVEDDASLKQRLRKVGRTQVRGRSQEVILFEVLV
ncbi:MAG: adenylate/guanylate cyclase domain-containing protein [Arenicellales bacterium WSBS_2016_MAG_OTU3]